MFIFVLFSAQSSLIIFCCFQSLALHDGCWKKISLERISPMLESTADSRVLAGSQFGLTPVERGCSLREPNTYEHGLLCDEGVHAGRSSTFSKRTRRSLEKQRICCSSHPESVASRTGSLATLPLSMLVILLAQL